MVRRKKGSIPVSLLSQCQTCTFKIEFCPQFGEYNIRTRQGNNGIIARPYHPK